MKADTDRKHDFSAQTIIVPFVTNFAFHIVKKSNFLRRPLKMDNLDFSFLSIFMCLYSRIYLLGHVNEKFNPKTLKTKQ